MAQTEIKKAVSINVLIVGLVIMAIGGFLLYRKNIFAYPLMFVGFIISIFWVANRKDQLCTFSDDDKMTCVDIKK